MNKQIFPKEIAQEVINQVSALFSKDGELTEKELVEKRIANERRACLMGLTNAKINHEALSIQVMSENLDPRKPENQLLLSQLETARQQLVEWQLRLQAVDTIAKTAEEIVKGR